MKYPSWQGSAMLSNMLKSDLSSTHEKCSSVLRLLFCHYNMEKIKFFNQATLHFADLIISNDFNHRLSIHACTISKGWVSQSYDYMVVQLYKALISSFSISGSLCMFSDTTHFKCVSVPDLVSSHIGRSVLDLMGRALLCNIMKICNSYHFYVGLVMCVKSKFWQQDHTFTKLCPVWTATFINMMNMKILKVITWVKKFLKKYDNQINASVCWSRWIGISCHVVLTSSWHTRLISLLLYCLS